MRASLPADSNSGLESQRLALISLMKVFTDDAILRLKVERTVDIMRHTLEASYCLVECTLADDVEICQSIQSGILPAHELQSALQSAMQESRLTMQTVRAGQVVVAPFRIKDQNLGLMAFVCAHESSLMGQEWLVEVVARQLAAIIYSEDLLLRERQAQGQLQELDRLRTEFLAMASHELRTPLTCIRGFVDTLLRADVSWSEANKAEFLESIRTCTGQALRIVDDLLSVQQAGVGKIEIDAEPIDVGRLVAEACRRAQNTTVNHTVFWSVPNAMPVIRADFVRLSQVLDNLLHNAIKYSPLGGEIQVKARCMLGEVELAVIDHGIGIPPSQREEIFNQFYRVDNSVSRRTEGLGLGLAIVRNIVLLHGGRVWVESTPGVGSTFYFTLPM